MTMIVRSIARRGAAALMLATLGACSSLGGLGSVLGSVLGQGGGTQVNGAIQGVDTRSQQVSIQQSNGQTVWVGYDGNTQVVYQNRNYPVTSLERGDRVTATIQDTGNGAYYASVIQVDQSVSGTGGANTQSFQGTVRQVDRANGWFTLDDQSYGRLTVLLPSSLSRADLDRFNALRSGDYVRLYGDRVSNTQVQFRQFN